MTLSQKNAAGALLIKIIIIITESPTWWFNKHVSTHPQRTDQKRPREARRHHGQNTCDVTAAGIRQTGVGSRRPSGRYRVTTSTGELAFSVEFNYRLASGTQACRSASGTQSWTLILVVVDLLALDFLSVDWFAPSPDRSPRLSSARRPSCWTDQCLEIRHTAFCL